ncbi:hypothetical protein KAM484_27870 [Aeromonas caviae]|nr:hypothetical protein KAM484_27870 [Aeromonas caviae]
MTIPFFRDGFALPVAPALLELLDQEIAKTDLNLERLIPIGLNIRSVLSNLGYKVTSPAPHRQ